MLLWVLAWIDRVNVGFVKLTMLDELRWSDAVYGSAPASSFSAILLRGALQPAAAEDRRPEDHHAHHDRLGPGVRGDDVRKVAEHVYSLRFLLGVFEAGFYPGIILYLTYWYPNERRARAFGMFMSASAVAGVIGGPLAGTIMTACTASTAGPAGNGCS